MSKKYSKLMFTMGAGQGKSRVMNSIGLLLLEFEKNIKTVHMVYTCNPLKEKDKQDFADMMLLS